MNKILAKIIAVALSLTALFSLTACGEVELGSKIERIQITIALTDAEGEVTEYEVEAKLYVNFAPETIAHVKTLIESGYYNGTDITNVTSSYFQFGDYTLAEDGKLAQKDGNVASIKGEFEKAGWVGNKLTVQQGAIILKRATEGENGGSKYATGKATLAVAFSSSAPFAVKEYCIFGQIVSDDGDKEADKDSVEYLSSLERMLKVKNCVEDANGRKVYYCVNDDTDLEDVQDGETAYNWEGQYFTYAEYEDEFTYFKGVLNASELSEENMLSDEEITDLKSKVSSTTNFMTIPALSAKIVSIKFVK